MRSAVIALLAAATLLSGQPKQRVQTFTGVITDSMCATGDHSRMKMGANDHECTIACVLAHGSEYVLSDGHKVYVLDKQEQGEKFAGQKVTISGTLKDSTLQIQSIRETR